MSVSLKKNVIYSSILTTANYIFPLLTYPYVSRILGVTNIGAVNFIDSIVRYFLLFSMMGINIVGIREIATSKNDPQKLRIAFNSLLILNGLMTLVACLIYILCWIFIPQLREQSGMMASGLLWLALSFLCAEWFYKGMEDFKFVTNRTIVVKTLYVISVFVFIKNSSQYTLYFILGTLMVVINALINIVHIRKYTKFSFHNLEIKRYFKPMMQMGVYMILTSLYTSFNVAFLGFACGDTQVGYYTTSTKLFSILLALFTAFTGVMMPRMSALIGEGKLDEFRKLVDKSTELLFAFSIPIVILVEIMAPQLIMLISGPGYEGAILPLRVVMPLMCVVGYEQILIIQTMMPLKEDKLILRNSLFAGLLAILLNFLLVPRLQSLGSALVWISCETFLLIVSAIIVRRRIQLKIPIVNLLRSILVYLPLIILFFFTVRMVEGYFFQLLVGGVFMVSYIILIQYKIMKNQVVVSSIDSMVGRFLRRK